MSLDAEEYYKEDDFSYLEDSDTSNTPSLIYEMVTNMVPEICYWTFKYMIHMYYF